MLHHFDPKYHIQIETDKSGYAIDGILRQLTLDDSGQWHLVVFFFQKMIPAKTQYETYNNKLLAIVKTLKTWCHYLQNCKYEIFDLIDDNNLHHFINTKNPNSRQIH